jgi:hypothetical protein
MNLKLFAFASAVVVSASICYADLTVTNGLQLWLKGDAGVQTSGSSVTNWLDQSGNNNNASHSLGVFPTMDPTYVANGFNGQPVVRFDGINDSLKNNSLNLNGYTQVTGFIVTRYRSLPTPGLEVPWFFNGNGGGCSYCFAENSPARPSGTFNYGISGSDGTETIYGSRPGDTNWTAFASSWTNNDFNSFINDGQDVVHGTGEFTSIGQTQSSPDGTRFTLGGHADNVFYADVDIAEILLYNRQLTAGERSDVFGYLAVKYNASIPEPSAAYLLAFGAFGLFFFGRKILATARR